MRRLFPRVFSVFAALAIGVSGATFGGVSPASADNIYDNHSPYYKYHYGPSGQYYRCVDSSKVISSHVLTVPGLRQGVIQLVRGNGCDTYWAVLTLYKGARGDRAMAKLLRFSNGKRNIWDCLSQGGNGYIYPGDGRSSCYTGMIYGPSKSVTFQGYGLVELYDHGGVYRIYSHAYTAKTR